MHRKAKEGDLYKILEVFGTRFELYYGYYDEFERFSPFGEPIPIYPDFLSKPIYTMEGVPYVTQMQSACEHYDGARDGEECHECRYFRAGEELIGLCSCSDRRQNPEPSQPPKPSHT